MSEPKTVDHIHRLLDIMATLRSAVGCPWDAEQTPESLKPYLLEETYEVLEAIDDGDPLAIRDELGDLLLQIVFHSRIFEERGHFTFDDVASAIAEKLIRRHPHVFAESPAEELQELAAQWERIKAEENPEHQGPLSGLNRIPSALPALARARKMAQKAAQAGLMRHETQEPFPRIRELLASLESDWKEEECAAFEIKMGELLFVLADLGRPVNCDAEDALRKATENFRRSLHADAESVETVGEGPTGAKSHRQSPQ